MNTEYLSFFSVCSLISVFHHSSWGRKHNTNQEKYQYSDYLERLLLNLVGRDYGKFSPVCPTPVGDFRWSWLEKSFPRSRCILRWGQFLPRHQNKTLWEGWGT
jgi:hypothetical protein